MPARDEELIIFHGHPSWRSMLGFHLGAFVAAVGAGVLAGILSVLISGRLESGWVILAVLVVFAAGLGSGLIQRRRVTYTITDERLRIEVGLLACDRHETRLEQIQNVNCSQSMFERALGVGDLCFDTAGGAAFEFAFRGVAQPRRVAGAVNDALLRRLRP